MAESARLPGYSGPALFSYGFRPFFLLGALWAGLAIVAWLPMFYGELSLATAFAPVDWHAHEMLFGYAAAVIAGFLLTAIANWTGRPPLRGAPLIGLVALWLAGRVAVTESAALGWWLAALVDVAFLVALAGAAGREIAAAENWRNLKLVLVVGLLAVANLGFHVEAHLEGRALYATRGAIGLVILLIMVVAGRIVPSFTRNWLMRRGPGRLPAPFDRFDAGCVALSALALVLWVVQPDGAPTAAALAVAALANLVRLGRWAGERSTADRLVLVLHVGFAFVPLGFALGALAALDMLVPSAGVHAWTAGAIGLMTLAVMSRASLGHTGRPLVASPPLEGIYAMAGLSALTRVAAALWPQADGALLGFAALAWVVAFVGFALLYAPMLCLPTRPPIAEPRRAV